MLEGKSADKGDASYPSHWKTITARFFHEMTPKELKDDSRPKPSVHYRRIGPDPARLCGNFRSETHSEKRPNTEMTSAHTGDRIPGPFQTSTAIQRSSAFWPMLSAADWSRWVVLLLSVSHLVEAQRKSLSRKIVISLGPPTGREQRCIREGMPPEYRPVRPSHSKRSRRCEPYRKRPAVSCRVA